MIEISLLVSTMKLTGIVISKVHGSSENTISFLGEEQRNSQFHLLLPLQVPIIPVVISSYSDFYSQKEKRFTPGENYLG